LLVLFFLKKREKERRVPISVNKFVLSKSGIINYFFLTVLLLSGALFNKVTQDSRLRRVILNTITSTFYSEIIGMLLREE
jgi:hypothetical protein